MKTNGDQQPKTGGERLPVALERPILPVRVQQHQTARVGRRHQSTSATLNIPAGVGGSGYSNGHVGRKTPRVKASDLVLSLRLSDSSGTHEASRNIMDRATRGGTRVICL